jgi:hypothetical protein
MFKMLIDTCVWLDVAKDRSQLPLLDVIDEMIRLDMLTLIIPRAVLDEFKRNKERVAQEKEYVCTFPLGKRCGDQSRWREETVKGRLISSGRREPQDPAEWRCDY